MSEDIIDDDIDVIIKNIKDFSEILQNKTILVVGGMGFLGTYFVKTLQRLNQFFGYTLKNFDFMITCKNLRTF